MGKFDYSKGIVNTSDRKRLYFFEEISEMLTLYDSSDNEVNELIYWLYSLSRNTSHLEPKKYETSFDYELKPDKQTDENTFIRNVWNNDFILYAIVSTIHDNNEKIYFKLDKIIHPDYRPGLDYEETRYYVEVEYISKEKQEKLKAEHNMDFEEKDWRA